MREGPFDGVPPALRPALQARGFQALTAIQRAVLDPELGGADLRISSQTGSGKTVAMGFLLAGSLEAARAPTGCVPLSLIIAPTRELALQVAEELRWLLAPLKARVRAVVGGTSVHAEKVLLRAGTDVLVGTPGRLLDHLSHQVVDPSGVQTVVLDEADQMLDLGFREELMGILETLPAQRRTILASATFSPAVVALARRFQKDPRHVQGTPTGRAHEDIDHVIHAVPLPQLTDAVVNVLLLAPEELTLIFVRTRADAAQMASRLSALGFDAAPLTGEMDQKERTRVMNAFRAGRTRVLVATDVAARGIDVPDLTRVVQADPPRDAEVYTHRSGRTGRAGRKGQSITLVPPQARGRIERLLRSLHVVPRVLPVPTAQEIMAAADERLVAELGQAPVPGGENAFEPHLHALAVRLLTTVEAPTLVHRLLARLDHHGPTAPRMLAAPLHADAPVRPSGPRAARSGDYVPFRINWGHDEGADARRLLALVCRRGNIRGQDVGAIRLGPRESTFEVAAAVAGRFRAMASRPDAKDPGKLISPLSTPTTGRSLQDPHHGPQRPPPRSEQRSHTRNSRPPPRTEPPARTPPHPSPARTEPPTRPPLPARPAHSQAPAGGAAPRARKKPRWTAEQKQRAAEQRAKANGGHAPPRKHRPRGPS